MNVNEHEWRGPITDPTGKHPCPHLSSFVLVCPWRFQFFDGCLKSRHSQLMKEKSGNIYLLRDPLGQARTHAMARARVEPE